MNPVTGEKRIEIGGAAYTLRFTWKALAEIEQKFGENPNLFDPQVIAQVAAAGLRERHPEMTAERIVELSPPLVPFAKDVQQAIQWAYFGNTPAPEGDVKKKSVPPRAGLFRRIARRLKRESLPSSSGA